MSEVNNGKNENKKVEENNIQISDDVVAVIAGMATAEVDGVADMQGGFAGGISEVLSGKKNMAKGIKVNIDEKETTIDVNIIVEYGARIPDVAFEIQRRVKKAVESMTGLNVTEVNVHVQGVATPQEKKVKEEKPKTEKPEVKKEEKLKEVKNFAKKVANKVTDKVTKKDQTKVEEKKNEVKAEKVETKKVPTKKTATKKTPAKKITTKKTTAKKTATKKTTKKTK